MTYHLGVHDRVLHPRNLQQSYGGTN